MVIPLACIHAKTWSLHLKASDGDATTFQKNEVSNIVADALASCVYNQFDRKYSRYGSDHEGAAVLLPGFAISG